jgi:predicted O-methyltransferase YrrM
MEDNIREYYATEPVHIPQYKEEFTELLKLFKLLDPYSILELGTHYGGTLYQWMINAKNNARIVSVDDHQLNSRMYKDWKKRGQDVHIILGKTYNEDIINNVRDLGPYDFIFIDADHKYESAWHDWHVYGKMADKYKPTLVVFHDILPYKNTEVDILWNEIKDEYIHWEFIEDETQAGCGIGVILIEPTE